MRWRLPVLAFGLLLHAWALALPSLQPGQPVPELRVLVDVSGSMRTNDPDGLALSGLELFASLLPDGSRASVWTFGTDASPLVPLDAVDDRWRNSLVQLATDVVPGEHYTDIQAALEAVDDDWTTDGDTARSVILLTDGQVDISADAVDNQRSRDAILGGRVASLQRAGVRVFPIALSDGADVDLMQSLALATGGFLSVAYSADELLKVFLDIITGSVPVNNVPFSAEGFVVDPFINEFTALLMLPSGNADVRLMDPLGRSHSALEHPDRMKWLVRPGYQMITAAAPEPGQWLLDAQSAPGSRVSIITDLLLLVEGLPANVAFGERLSMTARLEMEGHPLADPRLLELLEWRAVVAAPDGGENEVQLASRRGMPDARGLLDGFVETGVYTIRVIAEAGTLVRESTHLLRVYDDLFALDSELDEGLHRIRIRPRADFLDHEQTTVMALIRDPDGERRSELANLQDPKSGWLLEVGAAGTGQYQVELDITGQTRQGRVIKLQPDAILLGSQAEQLAPAPAPLPQAEPEQLADGPQGPVMEEVSIPWVLLTGLATIVLFGLFGLWLYRNRWNGEAPGVVVSRDSANQVSQPQDRGEADVVDPSDAGIIKVDDAPARKKKAGPVGPAYEGRAKKRKPDADEDEVIDLSD